MDYKIGERLLKRVISQRGRKITINHKFSKVNVLRKKRGRSLCLGHPDSVRVRERSGHRCPKKPI